MKNHFYQLAERLALRLHSDEDFTLWYAGEQSDFVRFNHGRVRQAGSVDQRVITLRLLQGERHAATTLTLTGDTATDEELLVAELGALRQCLNEASPDPHLLLNTERQDSEHELLGELPPAQAMVEEICSAARGRDLVGFLASGPIARGFANSLGRRNWHLTQSFSLDWSLYATADKAVKSAYAGTLWSGAEWRAKLAAADEQLALLQHPPRTIAPGRYRAYLAPAALAEIVEMIGGAFSEKAIRSKVSPLQQLAEGTQALHPAVTLTENTGSGLAPAFQSEGFVRPAQVPLIESGRLTGTLVSPRSAREYGLATNGANAHETAESIELAEGELAQEQVLAELDTGLYIGNLWYLNYVDPNTARMTGMTRFATFWVENGKLQAPLTVMRFDDSLYQMLGSELIGLTREREFTVDTGTYGSRQTASRHLPGALLANLRLVL